MKELLRDVLAHKSGDNNTIMLVGPKKVGKTVTLLWLYKKLVSAEKCVSILSPKLIELNIENIDFGSLDILLLDLHHLHHYSECCIDTVINNCRRVHIPLVVAASSLSSCLSELGHRSASYLHLLRFSE